MILTFLMCAMAGFGSKEGKPLALDDMQDAPAAEFPYTCVDLRTMSTEHWAPRYVEAFHTYCKAKSKDFLGRAHLTPNSGSACNLTDQNYAAVYEQVNMPTEEPAGELDSALFDSIAEIINDVGQLMAWGPKFYMWEKNIEKGWPDIIFGQEHFSHHPKHAEYLEPWFSDKWRSDRATILASELKICDYIHAQKGWVWSDDKYKDEADGRKEQPGQGYHRAIEVNTQRGIKVVEGKTKSVPLDHPYVVIGEMGDNWGWLSSEIKGKTASWRGLDQELQETGGCTRTEIKEWLDNPMVRGVVIQDQTDVFHEKILSVPLGHPVDKIPGLFKQFMKWKKNKSYPKKLRVLLINNSCWQHRAALTEKVERHLQIFNTYGLIHSAASWGQAVASSKFVLCPSGLGVDCYRIWEVLLYGSIPVIEHTPGWKIGAGWDKTFEDLPVMWCEDFLDLTPEILEAEYPKLVAKRSSYNYHKLTQQYWFDLVERMAQLPADFVAPSSDMRPDAMEDEQEYGN
jgi:hypothetical protein